jgi:hypothetical protein
LSASPLASVLPRCWQEPAAPFIDKRPETHIPAVFSASGLLPLEVQVPNAFEIALPQPGCLRHLPAELGHPPRPRRAGNLTSAVVPGEDHADAGSAAAVGSRGRRSRWRDDANEGLSPAEAREHFQAGSAAFRSIVFRLYRAQRLNAHQKRSACIHLHPRHHHRAKPELFLDGRDPFKLPLSRTTGTWRRADVADSPSGSVIPTPVIVI